MNWTMHATSKDLQMQLELKHTAPVERFPLKGAAIQPRHHHQFLLRPPERAESIKCTRKERGKMSKSME